MGTDQTRHISSLAEKALELNPKLGRSAVERAEEFVRRGSEDPTVRVLQAAQLIMEAEEAALAGDDGGTVMVAPDDTPTARVLAEEFCEAVAPEVRRLRTRLFGSDEPPFPDDRASALEWMEEMRADDAWGTPWSSEEAAWVEERVEELREAADRITVELSQLLGRPFEGIRPVPATPATFVDASGQTKLFGYRTGSELWRLADLTRTIARATGFREPDVVLYVLCGEPPTLPRIVARSKGRRRSVGDGVVDRAEVNATVLAPDITLEDLEELRAFIRSAWTRKDGGPPPTFVRWERNLLRMMREEGAADRERQPRGFWSDILERWNEAYPDDALTPSSLRKRWSRLQEKRDQLGLGGGTDGET